MNISELGLRAPRAIDLRCLRRWDVHEHVWLKAIDALCCLASTALCLLDACLWLRRL